MKLEGAALEAFEWYYESLDIPDYYINVEFKSLAESMQWGVIQSWGDSVGIEISTGSQMYRDESIDFEWYVYDYKEIEEFEGTTKTRQEARTAAVEKLNEIYNSRV